MEQLTDNVYRKVFKRGYKNELPINVYLLKRERILIDIGPSEEKGNYIDLKQDLMSVGIHLEDLNAIIITHHHVDHCGLLRYVDSSVKIIAPKGISYYMGDQYVHDINRYIRRTNLTGSYQSDIRSIWMKERFDCADCKVISPNEFSEFSNQYGIKILEKSGHSKCDLIIVDSVGNIFSGDIIIPGVFFNCIAEPNFMNRKGYYEELNSFSNTDSLVFPGHGEVLGKTKVNKSVNDTLKRMRRTERKVKRAYDEVGNDICAICDQVFGRFILYSHFLPFSEVTSIINENYDYYR